MISHSAREQLDQFNWTGQMNTIQPGGLLDNHERGDESSSYDSPSLVKSVWLELDVLSLSCTECVVQSQLVVLNSQLCAEVCDKQAELAKEMCAERCLKFSQFGVCRSNCH